MHRQRSLAPVTPENFSALFMLTVGGTITSVDAPDCPVAIAAGLVAENVRKCDCPTALRVHALAAPGAHPCGDGGRCPIRTYLAHH